MQIINSELIVMCDIDDTLWIWGDKPFEPTEGAIEIIDPYDNEKVFLVPHTRHIKLLGDYKARGYTIIVWSANGFSWAKTAVETLGLTETVDFVMSKPSKYMDDLPASEILGQRVFIPFMGIK